jgi:hypothetical protein
MGLSRADLWAFLDGAPVSIVAPLINDAYELELWRKWCSGGRPRTSFRLNEFPGDELACGRLAVYNLLDPPDAKPIEPKVQSWFDVGLDLEHHWVERLGNYGSLLSANVTADDSEQTRFEDPDHWCSGLVDVIVLPPGSHKAHVIEVKTTKDSNLQAILDDGKVPNAHAKYMRQLQSYIGYAHEQEFAPEVWVCKKSGLIALVDGVRDDGHVITRCPGKMLPTDRPHRLLHAGECELEHIKVIPPDEGTLIYSSRDEPLKTASFTARYSRSFMDAGRAQMASWRDSFLAEQIPAHPYQGQKKMWTADLCKFCRLKDPGAEGGCKMDYSNKISSLRESYLIRYIQEQDPTYDYDEKRAAVLRRWHAEIEREEPVNA